MSPLAGTIWNASVRPSAVQESGEPQGLVFPMTAMLGHSHRLLTPVASVYTAIAGLISASFSPFQLTATASLLPSGDSAMPSTHTLPGCTGMGRALSPAVRPSRDRRSTKNFVGVSSSRFSTDAPALPDGIGVHSWAASTNVRSSAAAVTQLNVLYGAGAATAARTAPVAVARTWARLFLPMPPGVSAT